jgi:hypothetical protein
VAKTLVKNARVEFNSVVLGNYAVGAEINGTAEVVDATGFGDTSRVKLLGFTNWTVTLQFHDDFAATGFNKARFTAWAAAVEVPIKIRLSTAIISTTNPEFQGNVLLTNTPLFSANIGAVSGGSITLEGSGTLTRAET